MIAVTMAGFLAAGAGLGALASAAVAFMLMMLDDSQVGDQKKTLRYGRAVYTSLWVTAVAALIGALLIVLGGWPSATGILWIAVGAAVAGLFGAGTLLLRHWTKE